MAPRHGCLKSHVVAQKSFADVRIDSSHAPQGKLAVLVAFICIKGDANPGKSKTRKCMHTWMFKMGRGDFLVQHTMTKVCSILVPPPVRQVSQAFKVCDFTKPCLTRRSTQRFERL